MGLMPLEYKDCITDSPYFRQKLHAHEKELDRTSQAIKVLTKEVKDLIAAAKGLLTYITISMFMSIGLFCLFIH